MVLVCNFVFLLHQQMNKIFLFSVIFSALDFSDLQNFCQRLNAQLYLFHVLFARELPINFKHSLLSFFFSLRVFCIFSCFLKIVSMFLGMLFLLNFSLLLL